MATVKRGAKGVRRAAAARGRAGRARTARAHTRSVMGQALSLLPFTEAQLSRIFLALILAALLGLAWLVAGVTGLNLVIRDQLAGLAANAGFSVRHVSVTGVEQMNELRVYERALAQRDQPMPLVDVAALREELLTLPWVKDARVSRQLPDQLAIDIVERQPRAVLAGPDRLVLIDGEGHTLEPVSAKRAGTMLRLSGPGVRTQVPALDRLLAAAPALKHRVRAAEWVGNRRWNLTFDTGQVLALPQGEDEAAGSLITFAKLDGVNRLLGGKATSFDMRNPDRLYMRIPGRAQQTAELSKES